MFQLGEFELWKGDTKLAWPAGTYVGTYSHNHTDKNDLWLYPPNEHSFNYYGGTYQNLIDGNPATRMGDDYSDNFQSDAPIYITPVDFTIFLGDNMDFDNYKFYIGDYQDERLPTTFKIQVSYDLETWYDISYVENYANYPSGHTIGTIAIAYAGAMDMNGITAAGPANIIADDNGLDLANSAKLQIVSGNEIIRALSGNGQVEFSGYHPTLTLKGSTADERFAGKFIGGGTLVIDGGTVKLNGANLSGVSKVILTNGATLKGTAMHFDQTIFEVGQGCTNDLRESSGLTIFVR